MKAASIVNEAYFVEQWKWLRKQLKPIGCVVSDSNCYIDFVAFMENPDKTWNNILAKEEQKAPLEPSLFD